ncbi:hypothetical protein A3740_18895 [Oleiphilus sp. HI0068]|uniref:hypothetical protein n=1 Tax=Oleiphilus sp. HI0132 TaxID=1822270 RepID=UPI0007C35363|nr:hypothetical protein [Oleiphilus sp. HI0132]KZY73512.1 hypothetical protein A3740_18895 [Oleiphilus sp. HI0068]KZY81204.1 hypothetical protein A3741_17585 [Oleiphilus sp. HI0069]KZZ76111.1 hypothetical protein A3766_14930 [Oleiphilus sp. HI0132]
MTRFKYFATSMLIILAASSYATGKNEAYQAYRDAAFNLDGKSSTTSSWGDRYQHRWTFAESRECVFDVITGYRELAISGKELRSHQTRIYGVDFSNNVKRIDSKDGLYVRVPFNREISRKEGVMTISNAGISFGVSADKEAYNNEDIVKKLNSILHYCRNFH